MSDLYRDEQSSLRSRIKSRSSRKLSWFQNAATINTTYNPYRSSNLAPVYQEYNPLHTAYRTLGPYIDCDVDKDSSGSGDNNEYACSRWMIWAAYVYDDGTLTNNEDVFYERKLGSNSGDSNSGDSKDQYYSSQNFDCHKRNSNWKLLGVYRQEFYQYLEQISKHLWALTEPEYAIALSGLSYITDNDCRQVGYTDAGMAIYTGIQPQYGGNFTMELYTDPMCVYPNTTLGLTLDDFEWTTTIDLGSGDGSGDDDIFNLNDDFYYGNGTAHTLYKYWVQAQEYSLSLVNGVYDQFRYCTPCLDYPSYQDGYFNGDGYEGDDLINQCWKFHSHDSFTCTVDCLSKAHLQKSIVEFPYGDVCFGYPWEESQQDYNNDGSNGCSEYFDMSNLNNHPNKNSKVNTENIVQVKLKQLGIYTGKYSGANIFIGFACVMVTITAILFRRDQREEIERRKKDDKRELLIIKWNKCGKRPKKNKYDVGSLNGIGSIGSMRSDDGAAYA